MRKHLLPFVPSVLLCLSAQAADVTDIGPLMDAARTQGRAEGTLGGEVMEQMRAMGIDQPVEVSVTRLHRLRDPGCARLKVEFMQRNVLMPGKSAPRDRHAEFQMHHLGVRSCLLLGPTKSWIQSRQGHPLLGAPRTDPGVPNSGTGLLPWMIDDKACLRPGMKDSQS